MKKIIKKGVCLAMAVLMAVCLMPADGAYAQGTTETRWTEGVTGGAIYFDSSSGHITGADKGVTSVDIPDTIEGRAVIAVDTGAFENCDSLKKVVMGKNVEIIGDLAFNGCTSLSSLTLNEGLKDICGGAFEGCHVLAAVRIPDTVTTIGHYSFYDCWKLTDVSLGKGLKRIDHYAFSRSDIRSLTIPSKVGSIDNGAFSSCTSLRSLTIENGVRCIGEDAFRGDSSLEKIIIPSSVTSILDNAFLYCPKAVIYGVKGSYAEKYAKENSIPFRIIDGTVKEPVKGRITAQYVAMSTKRVESFSADHDDRVFTGDNTEYDMGLSRVSLLMAMTTIKGKDSAKGRVWDDSLTREFMTGQLGLEGYRAYNGSKVLTDTSDRAAFAISHKYVDIDGKRIPIVALAVRSGDYGGEWYSNAQVEGGSDSSLHKGFSGAASEASSSLIRYMRENGIDEGSARVWISGFSRGAAVANLTGMNVLKDSKVDERNLYCYTFATPRTTQHRDRAQRGIFNTVNVYDVVPDVPFQKWGFGRYGDNKYVGSGGASLDRVSASFGRLGIPVEYGLYPTHTMMKRKLIKEVGMVAGDTDTIYFNQVQDTISDILGRTMGGGTGSVDYIDLLDRILSVKMDQYDRDSNALGRDALSMVMGGLYFNDLKKGADSLAMKQHWPEVYLGWLMDGHVRDVDLWTVLDIKCPVDVYVYDRKDGSLAAKIVNDRADESLELEQYVDENGMKEIMLPGDGDYRIEVRARDGGRMNYSVTEVDDGASVKKVNYEGVPLAKGDTFTGSIEDRSVTSAPSYDISRDDGRVIKPTEVLEGKKIDDIDIEAAAKGDGMVSGDGMYSSLDSVVLKAVPAEGAKFLGWYEGGSLVSSEAEYGFVAASSIKLEARFTKVLPKPELSFTEHVADGSIRAPKVMMKRDGRELIEGRDFRVTFKDKDRSLPGRYALTAEGLGEYSGSRTMHYTVLPERPASSSTRVGATSSSPYTVKPYNHDDVLFRWSASEGASGYYVYCKLSSDRDYDYIGKTTRTYYRKYNLLDGRKYFFKVVPYYRDPATGEEYASTHYKWSSAYTLRRMTTPAVKRYSRSRVRVYWDDFSGQSGYQISRSSKKTGTYVVSTYATTRGEYKTLSTRRGRTYYYRVRPYKVVSEKGRSCRVYGPWSYPRAYRLR